MEDVYVFVFEIFQGFDFGVWLYVEIVVVFLCGSGQQVVVQVFGFVDDCCQVVEVGEVYLVVGECFVDYWVGVFEEVLFYCDVVVGEFFFQ